MQRRHLVYELHVQVSISCLEEQSISKQIKVSVNKSLVQHSQRINSAYRGLHVSIHLLNGLSVASLSLALHTRYRLLMMICAHSFKRCLLCLHVSVLSATASIISE